MVLGIYFIKRQRPPKPSKPGSRRQDTDPLAKYTDANGNVDVRAALAGGVTADYSHSIRGKS